MLSVAMLLLVGTAILPLLNIYWEGSKWIFAFGAVLALAERLTERYRGDNLRVRRLYTMQLPEHAYAEYEILGALLRVGLSSHQFFHRKSVRLAGFPHGRCGDANLLHVCLRLREEKGR